MTPGRRDISGKKPVNETTYSDKIIRRIQSHIILPKQTCESYNPKEKSLTRWGKR